MNLSLSHSAFMYLFNSISINLFHELGDDLYWFAHIKLVCGQLVFASYLDQQEGNLPHPAYSWIGM